MNKILLVLAIISLVVFSVYAEIDPTEFRPFAARVSPLKQEKVLIRCYNSSGAPLIAGSPVVRDYSNVLDTQAVTTTTGDASNYLFYGVTNEACDTDEFVYIVREGVCNVSVEDSQSDTTSSGLFLTLGDAAGYFDLLDSAADTDVSQLNLYKQAPVGYILEAVASNATATGIRAVIYRR